MRPLEGISGSTLGPIEDVSRRGLLVTTFAAGFFVACGRDDDKSPADAPAATRPVNTPMGVVHVPVRPEHVVVFDRRGTLAYMLDLGVKPIAAMSAPSIYGGRSFHPLIEGDVANIAQISATEPDLEQVAALRPDLIVGFSRDAMGRMHDKVSVIAPTVTIPIDLNNPEDELVQLGEVFGMEEKAAQLIRDFESDVVKTKAKLRAPGRVSIILPQPDSVRIYAATNPVGQMITSLGGAVTPDITRLNPEPTGDIANVSFEQVSAIDGDTIVILANLGADWVSYIRTLLAMPVFQALPAVRAGRIVEVESQAVFGTAGLRGQRQVLDVLARAFA